VEDSPATIIATEWTTDTGTAMPRLALMTAKPEDTRDPADTRVVGAFPDGQSALNLAAARLRHIAGTAWSTNRYLNIDC
jgi:hypothetical protein